MVEYDPRSISLGPCPTCFSHLKPCRCQVLADLRKLVEKWRKDEKGEVNDVWEHYFNSAIGACADELEKLLRGE